MGSKWMQMEFVSHLLQDAGYEMLDEAIREVNNKANKWHIVARYGIATGWLCMAPVDKT